MVKEHVEDDERVHVVVVGPARARPTNVAANGRSIACKFSGSSIDSK